MSRVFWRSLFAVAALLIFLVWTSTTTTFLYKHPQAPDVRITVDSRTGAAIVANHKSPEAASTVAAKTLPTALPRVAVEQTHHNFGLMDPSSFGRHEFTVHNHGTAPLKLQIGPTTCKCTISGLGRNEIPPGESTLVSLEWHTSETPEYSHEAQILTNDPHRKTIEFKVHGKIRTLVGVDQPQIVEQVRPDQPLVVDRLVYSQVWDAFTVADLKTRIPGLKWEIAAVDLESVKSLQAKAVQRLRLTIPAHLPTGTTSDTLRLEIRQEGEDGPMHQLDLPFQGTVLRRLAFYGSAIDSNGVIDLGNVREGRGARIRLLAKVRDPEPDLPTPQVTIFPEFLSAELKPNASQKGLYDLVIELPDHVPPCQYRSTPIGRIQIQTGHPRIEPVELKVTFAVVPRPSL